MEKIEKIAMMVMELTDDDFREAANVVREQRGYFHPLKMGTTNWQHALGEHNEKVVQKIRELKETIETGKDIVPENYGVI